MRLPKPCRGPVCLALTLLASFAFGSDVTDFKPIFDAAMTADSGGIEQAIGQLDQLLPTSRQKGGLYVLKGSLQAKLADRSLLPWNKIGNVTSGVALMKEGIELVQADTAGLYDRNDALMLHLTRGITSGYIPSAFQSPDVCVMELEACRKMPEFQFAAPAIRAEALALLSETYSGKGQRDRANELKIEAYEIDAEVTERVLGK